MTEESTADSGPEEHVRPEQLFALLWANTAKAKDKTPEGEEVDVELARMFDDMDAERFGKPLPAAQQLGPETAARLWDHCFVCAECRLLLLEDGPGSRPPKTEAEVAQEVVDKDAIHRGKVIKFWKDLVIGTAAFGGAWWCMQTIQNKKMLGIDGPVLQSVGPKEIDPLWYAFMVGILIASWFLAEAYSIARDLWIDFDAWKRAVPVVGKKWADRDKEKEKKIGGG